MKGGGLKMIKCEQDSTKDQKKKCKLGYFEDTCKTSCCEAGFSPIDSHSINSKCANLEQPKEVIKNDGLKKCWNVNKVKKEEDQKCGKKFFLNVCKRSCSLIIREKMTLLSLEQLSEVKQSHRESDFVKVG